MIYGFPSKKMLLIAGPCSLESRDLAMRVAERVADRVSSAETSEKAARYATRLRNWAKQIRRMHPSD